MRTASGKQLPPQTNALRPLRKGCSRQRTPSAKEALELAGFPVGGVRLLLVNATAEQSAELERTMREVGVL